MKNQMFNKIAKVAIVVGCVVSNLIGNVKALEITEQPLPDGKTIMYICVRGRVTDPAKPEIPERDYGGSTTKGSSIEGATVWLKRNPQIRTITDDSGMFEFVVENGILSPGVRGKDDVICVWKDGYEFASQSILRKTDKVDSNGITIYLRDSQVRIVDYDATRYFRLKRTKKWDSLYANNKEYKIDYKTLNKIIKENSISHKAFRIPYRLPDGRTIYEINLRGIITDEDTGKPVEYAGLWLKRNPTILALTDEKGRYNISIKAVGLREATKELTDSICISAGMYKSKEVSLTGYKRELSFTIKKHSPLKKSGDFIELVEIPKTFFRYGTGVTQGGGPGRDAGEESSCYAYYPVKTVSLPSFQIGKYEVTLGQYLKVLEWSKNNGYEIKDIRELPIITFYHSWDDMQQSQIGMNWLESIKWCNAASEMEGRIPCYYTPRGEILRTGQYEEPQVKWKVNGYRLPTNAEWEYAGTAGTHFVHYWAGGYKHIREYSYDFFDTKAKYKGNKIFPVGKKKPNPFGLYDMIGNNGEWCWDWAGPIKELDTYHPKGCTKEEIIAWERNMVYGYYPPWKDIGGPDWWCTGPIWGEIAWDNIRLRYGNPMHQIVNWGLGLRVAVSNERGDENQKLPILYDRQYNLPQTVNLDDITDKIDLVDIPSGSILIGSFAYINMGKRIKQVFDERPEHKVYVSAFAMAKYETTSAQWKRVYDWALKNNYEIENVGNMGDASSKNENHPIVNITWYDIIKWCNAASEKEGLKPCYYMDDTLKIIYKKGCVENPVVDWNANGYRLPTEAEWEYAAFAGENDSCFSWGDHLDKKYAWFAGWNGDSNTDYPILQDYAKSCPAGSLGTPQEQPNPKWATHPVGQKIGNRFGLYDVYGNVWEMCWDWLAPYPMRIDDNINPKGPNKKEEVVMYMKNPYYFP